MTSFANEAGLPARLTPTALVLIMTSFATELATPSVTNVRTDYGHLTAFNI